MATAKKTTASKKTTKTAKKPAAKATKKVTVSKATEISTPKTSTKVKTVPQITKVESKPEVKKAESKPVRIKRSYVLLIAGVVLFALFLYFFRGWFVASVVNGQPISRMSVINEAEKQSGKQAMDTLVRNSLIEQEARKNNVTVSDKEVNDEIKKVEEQLAKQGQKIDQVLAMQGMSKEDLKELIRLDKMVGKIVGKDVKVTDEEVNEYIEKNRDALPEGQDEAALKASVKEQLNQQKLNEKVRTWLDDVQKKANIMYFVQY